MTEDDFRLVLTEQGYDEIRAVDYAPGRDGDLHTHDFSAMLLVLEGEFILVREDGSETLLAGETCAVPAGTVHSERTGEVGARVLAGIKPGDS